MLRALSEGPDHERRSVRRRLDSLKETQTGWLPIVETRTVSDEFRGWCLWRESARAFVPDDDQSHVHVWNPSSGAHLGSVHFEGSVAALDPSRRR